jgi:RNA recognition motif-containing protein
MATKLYVGNLSFDTTGPRLAALFAEIGAVKSAEVVQDYYTGRSRGFAFVEMADRDEAEVAVKQLNGSEFDGRMIRVSEARPRGEEGGGGALNRRYANGYASGKTGFGSDYPTGYGKIYGRDYGQRQRW